MRRSYPYLWLPLLALLAAALACNMPGATQPTDLAQMVAQTQTAIARGTQPAPSSLATITPATLSSATRAAGTPGAATPAAPTGAALTPGVSATPGQGIQPSTPAAPAANCTNLARFINETIPDNTQIPPGASFIKTWTLQNVGTCTWSADYALVFASGEQMGGSSPQPVGTSVAPNSTLQIFLPQTAPAAPGPHQGFWMLQNTSGQTFGLGEGGSKNFWVKINVVPGAPAPAVPGSAFPTAEPGTGPTLAPATAQNLGPATRTWNFSDNKAPFYLGEGEEIAFDVEHNRLILTAFEPAGDQWRVAEQSYVDNFALETSFTSGAECAGKDDYGLLVRAPSQPDNIVDSGYVFAFNCDGQYRVYRMDGGHYTGLVNWTPNPAVKAGPNQANTMTVLAKGGQFQFYANGTLLYQLADPTYSAGLFGLMIGSGGTEDFEVAVNQISWWDLP